MQDGVVAEALELVRIDEVATIVRDQPGGGAAFTAAELAYARSKSDPERRLAARLAAKRAAARLLGDGCSLHDVELWRAAGRPPSLRLSPWAEARLRELGADRTLVSLTHGREHAAASVLFVRSER